MCNVNTFEICIKVLLLSFLTLLIIMLICIKVVLAIVDYLLLCCVGYTNMNDYNGNYESNYMELLMEGDYKNYCDDHNGGELNDGNYNSVDNNDDGDNNDDDDESSNSDDDSD